MRTLRELAGWGLLLVLWIIPFAPLVGVAYWIDEGGLDGLLVALFGVTLFSIWPGLRHSAKRLRDPAPDEVAEADGRKPVLVLHRFEHLKTAVWRRLSLVSPAMWADRADTSWLAAIAGGLGPAGPIVPFARPAPPPAFGPVRDMGGDPEWEAALDRRLKTARLVAIVLDGSDACLHEIARAFAILGPRRTVLVMPARVDAALTSAWPAIQRVVPGLPTLDPTAVAYRFSREGKLLVLVAGSVGSRRPLLASPDMMLLPHEPTPAPSAPSVAWVLMLLPAAAGFFGAFLVPAFLSLEGVDVNGEVAGIAGCALVALGVTLSVMSRRCFRLVPMNELPLVTVAALPWLIAAGVPFLEGDWAHGRHHLEGWLRAIAWGAAYSTPLLFAVALVLAGSALVRARPGGGVAFGVFGVAALLPLGTLIASLSAAGIGLGVMLVVLITGALAVGLAAIGASGSASRAHTPLPVGAASAGVLAIAAWATVLTSAEWGASLTGSSDIGMLSHAALGAGALVQFGEAFVLFAFVAPAVVVGVASLFSGRASRVSVGNVAALLPMITLLALTSTAHAGARTAFSRAYRSSELMLTAPALGSSSRVCDFRLAALHSGSSAPERANILIAPDGVWVLGELDNEVVQQPSPSGLLLRLVARVPGTPRVAVASGTDTRALMNVATASRAAGRSRIILIGVDPLGGGRAIDLRHSALAMDGQILYFVQIRATGFALAGTDGTYREIPKSGPQYDYASLRQVLYELRTANPNRTALEIAPEHGVRTDDTLWAIQIAHQTGFTDLGLADASSL